MKKTYIVPSVEMEFMGLEEIISVSLVIDGEQQGDEALAPEESILDNWDSDYIEL